MLTRFFGYYANITYSFKIKSTDYSNMVKQINNVKYESHNKIIIILIWKSIEHLLWE